MPSLSIVIPVQGSVDALERTLVSVLEKRPADTEIIVVLNTRYDDPYQLTDEVRFVSVQPGAGWVECVDAGVKIARANVVHLLAAGAEVHEHWTRHVLEHFREESVWSVAPLTSDRCASECIVDEGTDATPRAERLLGARAGKIAGPAWWGGFYRRTALITASTGWDAQLLPAIATAELAWRQAAAGKRCVLEPNSTLAVPSEWVRPAYGFRAGYQGERLFWRRQAGSAQRPSLAAHALLLASLLLTGLLRPSKWLHLLGKWAALPSIGRFRQQGREALAAASATQRPAPLPPPAPHLLRHTSPRNRGAYSDSQRTS
ncbi:MAG: glycosyltransferase family 2 protein [Planctomycetaceae bacterium]|nr:glycosyltransferase family 2 protein [Planctomycetaceae bacterium]